MDDLRGADNFVICFHTCRASPRSFWGDLQSCRIVCISPPRGACLALTLANIRFLGPESVNQPSFNKATKVPNKPCLFGELWMRKRYHGRQQKLSSTFHVQNSALMNLLRIDRELMPSRNRNVDHGFN